MVARAKELGMDSIALTNHGNIFAVPEFYQECKKQGIKPIIGSEVYYTPDHDAKERHAYHLILICENETGWENLVKLTTRANEMFYFKPRIDFKDLQKHSDGLIALTACMHGPIAYQLFDKMTWPKDGEESQLKEAANIPKAYQYAAQLVSIFGKNNLFLEVQDGGIDEQPLINERVREVAEKVGVKTVATQDFHYVYQHDSKPHSFLKAMAFGKHAVEEGSHGFSTDEFYIKSKEEWLNGSSLLEEEVDRTREIADRCEVELHFNQMRLPKYPYLEGKTSIEFLKEKLRSGWRKRGIDDTDKRYVERVKHELADIEEAGLADYFLIVSDITDYCRDNDVALGTSRGSAGGSLVSFLLGITQLDPIKYDLIWERFYNAGRKGSMPDIDTDVEKGRRDEVIEYIRQRFGSDRVAQLVTFSSLGAKQSLRDVFRVAGIAEDKKNIIAGLIPAKNEDHGSITLKEAIEAVPKLKEYAENDEEMEIERNGKVIRRTSWKELFDIAQRLEGCYKTSGVHAAAVVISDKSFSEARVPLVKGPRKEELVCGWDMDAVDAFGLLKVDILGLATLDVLKRACKLVKERHGIDINLLDIPLDDPKVFEILGSGATQGIFQLESNLGKQWAKKCKPRTLEEIGELTAIIRPACLDTGMSDTYAAIKNGDQEPTYIHPILKPILEPTKGILIYQEQVIKICQEVAKMNLKDADAVRKVVGKKKPEELRAKKQQFMNGAMDTVGLEVADEIWGWIEKQAGYGFNKSHAIGYGLLSYWTAWMKANYYIEFLCANLIHAKDKCRQGQTPQDVISLFINDGKLRGVDVTPPRLAHSQNDFTIVDDNTISYGFSYIKGVGDAAVKSLDKVRKAQSFSEFVSLASKYKINKAVIDSLICAGALDDFGQHRRAMKSQLALAENLTEKEQAMLADYEGSVTEKLLALVDEDTIEERKLKKLKIPNINRRNKIRDIVKEYRDTNRTDTVAQILMWEKQFLGATLSGSMADLNRAMSAARHTCIQVASDELRSGDKVELCVVVEGIREVTVKRGKTQGRQMAFITISDSSYTLDGSCAFPDTYDQMKEDGVDVGDVISVSGKMSDRGLIINKVRRL